MGRKSGVEYLHLLDHEGREIRGAVLPLDYEFWSPDHRRFTVFFDPGRVKQGILPNQQMGRPLEAGQTVTLVVDAAWRDANGLPLKEGFRRQFSVRAAVDLGPRRTLTGQPLPALFPQVAAAEWAGDISAGHAAVTSKPSERSAARSFTSPSGSLSDSAASIPVPRVWTVSSSSTPGTNTATTTLPVRENHEEVRYDQADGSPEQGGRVPFRLQSRTKGPIRRPKKPLMRRSPVIATRQRHGSPSPTVGW